MTTRSSCPLPTPLIALATLACGADSPLPILLPETAGARTALIGLEDRAGFRAEALDLDAGEVLRTSVEGDETLSISLRLLPDSLAALGLTAGPIEPGPGGGLPTSDEARDFQRRLAAGQDSGWRKGELSPAFQSLTSLAFGPSTRCRKFETVASHSIGPRLAQWNHDPIRDAARLGADGLVLQHQNRLYRVSEAGVRDLSAELPDYERLFEGSILSLTTWQHRVVTRRCLGGTPAFVALLADGTTQAVPAQGLPACPRALASFGDQLAALGVDGEVHTLRAGEAEWRSSARFDGPIRPETFVAYAADGFAGLDAARSGEQPRYTARATNPQGSTSSVLAAPPRTELTIATPTAVDGRAVFALSAQLVEAEFYAGSMERPFELLARRGTHQLLGLGHLDGTVLATGFYGPIVQIDPLRSSARCPDDLFVTSSVMHQVVDLGGDRILLSGESNRDPGAFEPRPEPQRLTIVRALPL